MMIQVRMMAVIKFAFIDILHDNIKVSLSDSYIFSVTTVSMIGWRNEVSSDIN